MSSEKTELKAVAESAVPSKLGTGNPGLDNILHGGFSPHHVYLVEGSPGTGKTTLALQFLLEGVRRGETSLYVTLSETKAELESVVASHGWSLGDLVVHELVPDGNTLKAESQYTIFHPSEIELNETTKTVLSEVERLNPDRVVFDSLSEMRLLARDALRYRRQILALKQYFIGRQCTVMLLDDKTSDSRDLDLQSISHGVISLEHLALQYGSERRRLRVLKMRGSKFRGGYHDFTIRTGGVEIFPRLVASERHMEFARENVSCQVEEMDNLLCGGLRRGTSTLVIGPAGAGKSTLSAQFAIAGAMRGEKSAVFLFDEVQDTYLARLEGIGADVRDEVASGTIMLQQVDPAELSPGEFATAVMRAVDQAGARIVIIDSLNGYLNAMPEERFLTAQMHELLTYLNQQGVVTILVVAQHGLLGTGMQTPIDLTYLADTVIVLRYFESQGRVRRAVSAIKKRSGAHEDTIREFMVTSAGIRVGLPLTAFRGVLTGTPVYVGEFDGSPEAIDDMLPGFAETN